MPHASLHSSHLTTTTTHLISRLFLVAQRLAPRRSLAEKNLELRASAASLRAVGTSASIVLMLPELPPPRGTSEAARIVSQRLAEDYGVESK